MMEVFREQREAGGNKKRKNPPNFFPVVSAVFKRDSQNSSFFF